MTFIKRHATTRVVRKRVKYRYSSNSRYTKLKRNGVYGSVQKFKLTMYYAVRK